MLAPLLPEAPLPVGREPLPNAPKNQPSKPTWQSYSELLRTSLDGIFPRHCSQSAYEATLHGLAPRRQAQGAAGAATSTPARAISGEIELT